MVHLSRRKSDTSKTTVNAFYRNLKYFAICELDRPNIKLGGDGKIIEIDKSLFAKVKHGSGHDLHRKQVWVFGMMERGRQSVCLKWYQTVTGVHTNRIESML
jgi:hypothetical protein